MRAIRIERVIRQTAHDAGHAAAIQFQVRNGAVTDIVRYDSCVLVPIRIPSVKVVNGAFSYTGNPYDYLGDEWRVHVDGVFVSRTQATGHWSATQLTNGNCASHSAFNATRQ